MMVFLNRIEVEGFKSIQEVDLELKPLNILIGANGSGKSNFIGVFKLLNRIIESRLQTYVAQSGGAETFLHFGRKNTNLIRIHLQFESGEYEVWLRASDPDELFISGERYELAIPGTAPYHVTLNHSSRETKLHENTANQVGKIGETTQSVLEALRSWKVYHFHDTSESAKVKLTGDIYDNFYLNPDGGNLAAFLYLLQQTHPDSYRRIVETIRLAAPFFDDFVLLPRPENPNTIQLRWRPQSHDVNWSAHLLSDGILRFMCLTTLLMQPNLPSTILIDEPELGLHPYAITLLAAMLQSAAIRMQVVISTQSVSLVSHFAAEDVIVVERDNGASTFRRLESDSISDWLEDYSLGELWEKNVIGGRP